MSDVHFFLYLFVCRLTQRARRGEELVRRELMSECTFRPKIKGLPQVLAVLGIQVGQVCHRFQSRRAVPRSVSPCGERRPSFRAVVARWRNRATLSTRPTSFALRRPLRGEISNSVLRWFRGVSGRWQGSRNRLTASAWHKHPPSPPLLKVSTRSTLHPHRRLAYVCSRCVSSPRPVDGDVLSTPSSFPTHETRVRCDPFLRHVIHKYMSTLSLSFSPKPLGQSYGATNHDDTPFLQRVSQWQRDKEKDADARKADGKVRRCAVRCDERIHFEAGRKKGLMPCSTRATENEGRHRRPGRRPARLAYFPPRPCASTLCMDTPLAAPISLACGRP